MFSILLHITIDFGQLSENWEHLWAADDHEVPVPVFLGGWREASWRPEAECRAPHAQLASLQRQDEQPQRSRQTMHYSCINIRWGAEGQ